jgi:hypothetical protein
MVDSNESLLAKNVLGGIPQLTGVMWDKIKAFQKKVNQFEGTVNHKAGEDYDEEMSKMFPLKEHLEGGIYTRELFMPKHSVLVSMIHKQSHPTFITKGCCSYLDDKGVIRQVKAPYTIFTQVGAQRVFVMHEDTTIVGVYKTNAKTFKKAEADVYTNDYNDLSKKVIKKIKKLWQDPQQAS